MAFPPLLDYILAVSPWHACKMADISMDNQRANFNTGPPLEIKNSKIGIRHVLSWSKSVIEPKFHDPGTFGGFGKR